MSYKPVEKKNTPGGASEIAFVSVSWMQRREAAGNTSTKGPALTQRHRFVSVKDSRNRKVHGLWQRNGIYYVQFWVAGETSPRRVRLQATTLEAAKKEMAYVRQERDQQKLPTRGQKPFFAEFVREYIALLKMAVDNQRQTDTLHTSAATIAKEESSLKRWIEHFGRVRVDGITRAMIAAFSEKQLAKGNTPRTVNLQVNIAREKAKLPSIGFYDLRHYFASTCVMNGIDYMTINS